MVEHLPQCVGIAGHFQPDIKTFFHAELLLHFLEFAVFDVKRDARPHFFGEIETIVVDVGLEMSGNPAAFNGMIDNMCHGGKIAMLGIPSEAIAIDWNKVVFNMLTIKGIYGREMYETWYMMSVMLESGLDIRPVITHRLHYTEFEKGFQAMLAGNCGKVILNWRD